MNKSFFSLLCVAAMTLLCSLPVSGRQLSPSAALSRLSSPSMAAARARLLNSKARFVREIKTKKGTPALYLYNLSSGYLVLSADDRVLPLLGYSDTGNISDTEMPESLQWWLNQMSDEVQYILDSDSSEPDVYLPPSLGPAINPLVKAEWGQTDPFNLYTPIIKEKQSPTGCVATALTQIMYHYRWPLAPQGEISYTDTSTPANDYSIVYDGMSFNWDLMTDIYNEESSDASKDAVASLMKAVGYGVKMNYGASSSGATDANALDAMKSYFKYSDDAIMLRRESTTRSEWDSMIYNMLANGMPVYYTGRDAVWIGSGGHAFVCDGYDGNGYFHFNWGWNGNYNGYFLTTCLVPAGAGTGGYINGYNYTQSIMLNLHPDDGESYSICNYVIGKDFKLSISDNTISASLISNKTSNGFEAGIAVNDFKSEKMSYFALGEVVSNPQTWTIPADLFSSLDKEQIYELRLVWRTSATSGWNRVLPEADGFLVYSPVETGGALVFSENNWTFYPALTDLDPINVSVTSLLANHNDYYISGLTNSITLSVTNHSNDYEYIATRCYAINDAGESELFFNTSVELSPNQSRTYNYTLQNNKELEEGTYTLRFFNVNTTQEIPTDNPVTIKVFNVSSIKNVNDGTFTYSIVPGYKPVLTGTISGEKASGKIVIPAEITVEDEKYIVGYIQPKLTDIIDKATVTSLTIEFPITDIADYAFNSCENLTELHLPSSVRNIGKYAFSTNKNLRVLTLPEELESLGERAFSTCKSLEQVNIPVTKVIPSYCFYNPEALTEIVIPEGVERIENSAFYNWMNLQKIVLPSTLRTIEKMAFAGFNMGSTDVMNVEVHSTVPPVIESNTFRSSIPRTATLSVPRGTRDAYMAAPYWNAFKNIEETDLTTDIISIDENDTTYRWFTIDGVSLSNIPTIPGIYVRVSDKTAPEKIIIR
ncbi:MAG: C10 family peptidase [Muribaculaceae bacterium]|nr:C10 family peptidase [Muribaculaceae bacterium]